MTWAMSHDKGKTAKELGEGLASAKAHLARLRDEIRGTESEALRKAHEQIVEAEAQFRGGSCTLRRY